MITDMAATTTSFSFDLNARDKQTPRPSLLELERLACQARIDALEMIYAAQSGHPGTSFSCVDVLVALWSAHMRHDVKQPECPNRDRFVMSKGHGAPALYAVLMAEGYISRDEKPTLRQVNSNLQGHPASRYVFGVDVSTGSLGHGLSCAVGMALGHRLNGSDARVYTLLGDGECQEGNVWEAVMSAAHHKVSRLTAFIDRNNLQIDGNTEEVKALGDVEAKFKAFDWNTIMVNDAHDFSELLSVLDQSEKLATETDRPTAIILTSVKGKGVSFMENEAGWHGKAPNADEMAQAMKELDARYQALSAS